jgi:hypothetical protein
MQVFLSQGQLFIISFPVYPPQSEVCHSRPRQPRATLGKGLIAGGMEVAMCQYNYPWKGLGLRV